MKIACNKKKFQKVLIIQLPLLKLQLCLNIHKKH